MCSCLIDYNEQKHENPTGLIWKHRPGWWEDFQRHFSSILGDFWPQTVRIVVLRGCPTTLTAVAPSPVTLVVTEKSMEALSLPKSHHSTRWGLCPSPRPFTPQDGVLAPILVPAISRSPRRGFCPCLCLHVPSHSMVGPLFTPLTPWPSIPRPAAVPLPPSRYSRTAAIFPVEQWLHGGGSPRWSRAAAAEGAGSQPVPGRLPELQTSRPGQLHFSAPGGPPSAGAPRTASGWGKRAVPPRRGATGMEMGLGTDPRLGPCRAPPVASRPQSRPLPAASAEGRGRVSACPPLRPVAEQPRAQTSVSKGG